MSDTTPFQLLRSSTAHKRPNPAGLVDGRPAINTNNTSPGLFFKDSNGALVKVGPVHVGPTAPNSSPAVGGSTGNAIGEQWLDTAGGTYVFKVWDGSAWRSESGTFVDVNGDVMTGALVMDNQQQIRFRETTANGTNYIALQAPASVASDKTITLPDVNGTVVTTGDTGTVTSTMILDGTIVNADINASAAIAGTKISPDFGSQTVQTTGIFSHALGSASAPTVTFTGDTNTGIYSPGADQVAVATGGSGRLFVDANGNLLVGANNNSGGLGERLSINGAGLVTQSAAATNRGLFGTFGGSTQIIGAFDSIPLEFRTGNSERLRITAAGLVGVGTFSPGSLLTTYPGNVSTLGAKASTGLLIDNNGSAGNISQIGLGYTFSGTYHPVAIAAITDSGSGSTRADLHFATRSLTTDSAPDTRMIIKSDGKVGIGVSSPGSVFHARLPNTSTAAIATFDRSDGAVSSEIHYDGSDGRITFGTTTNHPLSFETNNTRAVTIDTSQRVGIGTTSASALCHVYAGNSANTLPGNAQAIFESSANGGIAISVPSANAGGVYFPRGTDAYYSGIERSGTDFNLRNNGQTRATIDSSGRFLVGTSSTSATTSVILQGSSGGSTSNAGLILARGEVPAADGTVLGALDYSANNHVLAARILCKRDGATWTAGSSQPTRLEFSTTADGASSPTERMRIQANGTIGLKANGTNGAYFGVGSISIDSAAWSSGAGTNAVKWSSSTGALTWDSSSRLVKDNIEDCIYGMDAVKQLRPRIYTRKDSGETEIGFIADEVQSIISEVVPTGPKSAITGNADDTEMIPISVNYDKFVAVLTKALQEAMERIETLEAAVAALEA